MGAKGRIRYARRSRGRSHLNVIMSIWSVLNMQNADGNIFSRGLRIALTSPLSQESVRTIDEEKGIIEYIVSSGFTALGACSFTITLFSHSVPHGWCRHCFFLSCYTCLLHVLTFTEQSLPQQMSHNPLCIICCILCKSFKRTKHVLSVKMQCSENDSHPLWICQKSIFHFDIHQTELKFAASEMLVINDSVPP